MPIAPANIRVRSASHFPSFSGRLRPLTSTPTSPAERAVERLRIGIVSDDPLRVEGLIAMLSGIAEPVPMTPTDAIRHHGALTMVLIDATDRLFLVMAAYRRARPGLRLLVFGESADPRFIGQVVAAGAKGYLSHTASAEEILMAVSIIADGSIWAPRKVLASLIDTYSPVEILAGPVAVRFTPREKQVLQLLIDGQADREIAQQLGLSPRTVQSVISRLLFKTGVGNRVALTVRALERSLLL